MHKVQHPSNNAVLGAPAGWNQQAVECGALPVTRFVHNGVHMQASFWMPTPNELAALNCGHPVQLTVVGDVHPPVSLNIPGVQE